MVHFRHILTLLAVLVLLVPSAAVAQSIAPPGNSAIDEYRETVPDAGGGRTPTPRGEGSGTLSDAERRKLEAAGTDGQALADVIEQTAQRDDSDSSQIRRPPTADLPEVRGRSPITQAASASLGGDAGDGLGLALPLILGAALLGGIAVVLARRRGM